MTDVYKNDPVLLEWCEQLLIKGKFEDAEKFAHVLHEAKDHSSLLMLARALDANGKSKKATKLLKTQIEKHMGTVGAEMFEVTHLNGKILASMGKLKSAEKNLQHSLRILPQDECFNAPRASTEYQLASLQAALGKFHPAQKKFNKAMPVNCDNGWKTSARIVDFFVESSSQQTSQSSNGRPFNVSIESEVSPDVELIYFVAGDVNYCNKFAPSLVKHLEDHAGRKVHLHIHGVSIGDKDPGAKKGVWDRLRKSLEKESLSISVSSRHINVNHLTATQIKSIYSFERFWILPSLLEAYDKPVLVADLDQIPLRDPLGLLADEFDAALLKFPKGVLNILSVISATLSVFRPTPKGRLLAEQLSEYFTSAFGNDAKLNWHVDQAALAVMDYKNEDANILYLSPKLVVTDPTKFDPVEATENGAWFWSVTNSIEGNARKLELYNSKAPIK